MKHTVNKRRSQELLTAAREKLAQERFDEALTLAYEVISCRHEGTTTDLPVALDLMEQACILSKHLFFGSEFRRHAKRLRGEVAPVVADLPDFTDQSPSAVSACNLLRCLAHDWHRLGVPVLPSLGMLHYAASQLVTEPVPHLISMSWWYPLPMILADGRRPVALVTAYDLGDETAREIFSHLLKEAPNFADEINPIITASGTSTLGVISRMPLEQMREVFCLGQELLQNGLPAEQIPVPNYIKEPEEFIVLADKMSGVHAYLLAIPLYRQAAEGFLKRNDTRAYLLTMLRQAIAIYDLGQTQKAQQLLDEVQTDASDYGQSDVAELMEGYLRKMHSTKSEVYGPPEDCLWGPFTYDPATGKVIGGVLLVDAEHEYHAASILITRWEALYPGVDSPFCGIYAVTSFEYDVPVLGQKDQVKKMRLGQLVRQAFGQRLSDNDLGSFIQHGEENYLTTFSTAIFRALSLMHVYLGGTYTSDTGSSLTPDNLTPHPKLYDYETVLIPDAGDPPVPHKYQYADLVHGFRLVLGLIARLSLSHLKIPCCCYCFEVYVQSAVSKETVERFVVSALGEENALGDADRREHLAHSLAQALSQCMPLNPTSTGMF